MEPIRKFLEPCILEMGSKYLEIKYGSSDYFQVMDGVDEYFKLIKVLRKLIIESMIHNCVYCTFEHSLLNEIKTVMLFTYKQLKECIDVYQFQNVEHTSISMQRYPHSIVVCVDNILLAFNKVNVAFYMVTMNNNDTYFVQFPDTYVTYNRIRIDDSEIDELVNHLSKIEMNSQCMQTEVEYRSNGKIRFTGSLNWN